MEPISASTGLAGLRMIWAGIQWTLRFRRAPWSVLPIHATLEPHIIPWYAVRFFCRSDKSFAVEMLRVRTVRPKKLPLCKADPNVQIARGSDTEGLLLDDLKWLVEERDISTKQPFQRYLFVNLDGLAGEVAVDFEFKARFLDSRRTEVPILIRTNPVKLRNK